MLQVCQEGKKEPKEPRAQLGFPDAGNVSLDKEALINLKRPESNLWFHIFFNIPKDDVWRARMQCYELIKTGLEKRGDQHHSDLIVVHSFTAFTSAGRLGFADTDLRDPKIDQLYVSMVVSRVANPYMNTRRSHLHSFPQPSR